MEIPPSILALFFLAAAPAFSQVSVTNGTYSQDFDSLIVSGSGVPWTDNSTLQGWYAKAYQTPNHPGTTTSWTPSNIINGTQFPLEIAAYGNPGERAMGSGINGQSATGYTVSSAFGVRLVNNTGALVTDFSVSYIGEQWSRGENATQVSDSLAFSYQIFDAGTGSLAFSSWISAANLDFISPDAGLSTAANLDGNLSENQAAVSGAITGSSLADGQELWIRWLATDGLSITDHHLAIDNLTVTFGAIPEPAAFAAWLGASAALTAGLRRRRS